MKVSEAIKWIDNRMCFGRGQWTKHHQPIIDEPWQAGLMAIEALQNSQWIPCSERLPERNGVYLVTVVDFGDRWRFVDKSRYVKGEWYTSSGEEYSYRHECFRIIAWRPEPEPYKGKINNEGGA